MANEKDSLHEGDGILLFCSKAEGFIYSPPPLRQAINKSIEKQTQMTNNFLPVDLMLHLCPYTL